MRTLNLKVEGQKLTLEPLEAPIIGGTKGGYLRLNFSLGSEWSGYNIAVSFWSLDGQETAVRLRPGFPVPVPDELTDDRMFRVSLTGARGDVRITTNKVSIRQRIMR